VNCRFDPSGFIVEHYVDGDLVDESHPVNRTLASPDNLHVWGRFLFLQEYIGVTLSADYLQVLICRRDS
jgi:hypothetical protein